MAAPRRTVLAGIGFLSLLTAAAGFAADHYARIWNGPDHVRLSASQSVEQRFPEDWREPAASPPEQAFASTDALWFQAAPLYPIKSEAEVILASVEDLTASVPHSGRGTAEPGPKPLASASVKRRSNAVLSEAQLAGIKKRLNLTAEQERYWPAVAAELRKMEYKKDAAAQGPYTAAVDMSRVNVAGLRSAGLPLVMSFNDEQKEELKGFAHLLGIGSALPGL
jgi:hypothetical protein